MKFIIFAYLPPFLANRLMSLALSHMYHGLALHQQRRLGSFLGMVDM